MVPRPSEREQVTYIVVHSRYRATYTVLHVHRSTRTRFYTTTRTPLQGRLLRTLGRHELVGRVCVRKDTHGVNAPFHQKSINPNSPTTPLYTYVHTVIEYTVLHVRHMHHLHTIPQAGACVTLLHRRRGSRRRGRALG